MTKLRPATIAAQALGQLDHETAGVVPAIHPATTFVRDHGYDLVNPNNVYSRDNSENLRQAERVLAALEGASDAMLLPSGMAAVAAVFRALPTGATVVLQSGIYWGTTHWVRGFCARRGVHLVECDLADTAAAVEVIQSHKPDLVWAETPSNPWLKICDIKALSREVHLVGGLLVVDSTAASPVLSQPLALGADIVMHSATKGINGHSDVLAGALAINAPQSAIWAALQADRHDAGAVLGPFEAWLLLRGMRTLPLRMERMCTNAQAIAEHLAAHPKVEAVLYPGLPSHPAHSLAQQQMPNGFGCLLSFLTTGDALTVVGKLKRFHRATSLGGVESLVEHRHTIEPHTGIPENLIRVSVGIEAVEDLIADLDQALA